MTTTADTLTGSHVLLVGTAEWTTTLADALETHGSSVRTAATARDAAYIVALRRLAGAQEARGRWP